MTKVVQTLGNCDISIQNGFSLCLPKSVEINLWEDLGSISTDRSLQQSSGLNCIEYEDIENNFLVLEAQNTNICSFKQILIEIVRKYQFDVNDLIVLGPNPFKRVLRQNILNKSSDVMPRTETSFGTFVITIPRGRFVSFDMNIFGTCTMNNLPNGIDLKNNTLSGITWESGTWRGEIITSETRTPYSIIIPQIERVF